MRVELLGAQGEVLAHVLLEHVTFAVRETKQGWEMLNECEISFRVQLEGKAESIRWGKGPVTCIAKHGLEVEIGERIAIPARGQRLVVKPQ